MSERRSVCHERRLRGRSSGPGRVTSCPATGTARSVGRATRPVSHTAGRVWRSGQQESGQISVLLVGLLAIALMLVLGVVGATSVQLSRIHLLDAADAAALAASDTVDADTLYQAGLGEGVPLTSTGVRSAARDHLAQQPVPDRVSSWWIAEGTGTPDARTAVVRIQGDAKIPVVSGILSAFGGHVRITVESRARSELE